MVFVIPASVLMVAAFATAYWMTGWFRQFALRRRLVDIPNARSSHDRATPRGGGMAIVATVALALPVLVWIDALSLPHALGLGGAGLMTACVGFCDDVWDLPASARLVGHFTAAAFWVSVGDSQGSTDVSALVLSTSWTARVVAAVYLVWLLNLTNFMDGIDGIAAVEVVTVTMGGALIAVVAAPDAQLWGLPIVLAASTAGFLMWNWPPAKVFLGDGGSGFLGVMLGALSLQAGWLHPALWWSWVILLGVFIVDATVTLTRRLFRGERVYHAHRSHAYQHLAQRLRAHGPVTVIVGVTNIVWLLPIAAAVAFGHVDGPYAALLAYAPITAAALWLRAGAPARPV